MEKIHGNMHVLVFTHLIFTRKHKNMRVSMYFLHLVLTFTPIIIMDKGLFHKVIAGGNMMHVQSSY